uniref:WD repeat-containing protein 20-like isoform X1 n=1 Tax=Styela clava TaxID=7725 RepID=UPI001939C47A|nr:WD repeat-containing protein 20-like isoform X1 [Styela clava]
MALDGGGRELDIRSRFTTREGTYKQMPNFEYCRPNRVPYTAQGPPSAVTPVKASFTEIDDKDVKYTRIVFTIGRDLFYFNYEGVTQPVDLTKPLDKRTYKGVAPTCHDINRHTATMDSVRVAVGFAAGQIQIIDVGTKESLMILNEERMVDKISTTCVKWVPGSDTLLISSHANGHMYTYDSSHENMNVVPQYHEKPHKTSGDITIHTLKNKTYTSPTGAPLGVLKNPLYKWIVTNDNSAIHEFQFSADGKNIAIVSQDGYLRVVDYNTFEMKGSMKSYFGGLLCCCWSPDGRYIVTGGEDDLVTVWAFYGGFVLARGHGHRSWVSNVSFDKYCCCIPDEEDVINWYSSESPSLSHNDVKCNSHSRSSDSQTELQNNKFIQRGRHAAEATKLKLNDHTQTTKKGQNLNDKRDLRSPVNDLHDLVRRQRTNSTVSRLSRMSLAGSVDIPPRISYRFGSVGQDAQLCLWELTDETLFPRRRTVTMLNSHGSVHSRGRGDIFCSHFLKPTHHQTPSPINGHDSKENIYDDSHSGISPEYITHASELKSKHSKSNSTSNVTSPIKEHTSTFSKGLHFFTSSKDSSKADHNPVAGSSSAGKFATLGSSNEHNQRKENIKEHKRNLSMPHFGSKNTNHSQSSSNGITKHLLQTKKQKQIKTLGTNLCPRLEETTMLEPLVCKRITQGRLNSISFQEDSIVTACQDGFIQTWARPHQHLLQPVSPPKSSNTSSSTNIPTSPSSPPKISPSSKSPGTVV